MSANAQINEDRKEPGSRPPPNSGGSTTLAKTKNLHAPTFPASLSKTLPRASVGMTFALQRRDSKDTASTAYVHALVQRVSGTFRVWVPRGPGKMEVRELGLRR